MGNYKQTPWTIIISVLTILSLIAVIAYGRLLSQEYKHLNTNLRAYVEDASKKQAAIDELHSSIGYGGLIHNFKNYVLRQNEEYYARVSQSFEKSNYWVNKLGQMIKSEDEIQQLRIISQTLAEYKSNFSLAEKLVREGISPFELDQAVVVNDTPALAAMNRLTELSISRSRAFLERTNTANRQYALYLNLMIVIGVIVVLVGLITIFIVRKLSLSVDKTIESLEYIKTLYDATPDALLAVSKDGIIVKANRQAEKILGYHIDVLVGMKVEQLLPEKIRQSHVGMRNSYFENPGFRPMGSGFDLKARRSDGHEIEVEISLSYNNVDNKRQAIVAIRDMTNVRKTERELAISLRKESRASKFKAKLLSNMSHELRTPLSHISGFTHLLSEKYFSEVQSKEKEWISEVQNATNLLLRQIDKILDFADNDPAKGKIKVMKIGDCLEGIYNDLMFEPTFKNVKFEIEKTDDLDQIIYCARSVLEEVVSEVMMNAAKFNHENDPHILMKAILHEGDIVVKISDNGPGLPDKAQESAFLPFERLDAFDHAIDGVGMGLALARQMIKTCDGQIAFEKSEKGAVIVIKLPYSFDPF